MNLPKVQILALYFVLNCNVDHGAIASPGPIKVENFTSYVYHGPTRAKCILKLSTV